MVKLTCKVSGIVYAVRVKILQSVAHLGLATITIHVPRFCATMPEAMLLTLWLVR